MVGPVRSRGTVSQAVAAQIGGTQTGCCEASGDRGAIEAHTIEAHKKKAHVTVRLEMAALLPLLLLDTPFSRRLAAHRD